MKEVILDVFKMANKPLKSGEVVEQSGIEKKDVDKSIKILIRSDKIYSPKRCYYSVK